MTDKKEAKEVNNMKSVDLNKLSFQDLKAKIEELEKQKETVSVKNVGVWQVGKNYFIRTVTHHLTGKLVNVTKQELVLESAAWIADDGRFTDALENEEFSEVELFPKHRQVIVGRGSLIDAVQISRLPDKKK